MGIRVVWHGTEQERVELLKMLLHHCECQKDARGARVSTCAVHEMIVSNQRALDGLLWMRRIVSQLRAEEFELGAVEEAFPPGSGLDESIHSP